MASRCSFSLRSDGLAAPAPDAAEAAAAATAAVGDDDDDDGDAGDALDATGVLCCVRRSCLRNLARRFWNQTCQREVSSALIGSN